VWGSERQGCGGVGAGGLYSGYFSAIILDDCANFSDFIVKT